MIFVDTSGWVALEDPADGHHQAAARYRDGVAAGQDRLVTSCYVFDETYTLLLREVGPKKVRAFRERVLAMERSRVLDVVHLSHEDEAEAWEVLERIGADKKWSFTDCTSQVVCAKRRVQRVFAFDHHFVQMGLVREPQ
ncbi:MAG: type II toxin-antitoxin system VapC family toxin [Nitrospirae bacterium]|nr:type II toxin-antitoxin system VapC family toxin [Nitrospirota bacterium]